jgi:predicted TIM-barrel fold metal-dependent hydrolase
MPARALESIDALGLDDQAKAMFLGGNAARVFRLA